MPKQVLEEEQYVEALEEIIERDFFPDLPTLRKQTQVTCRRVRLSVWRPIPLNVADVSIGLCCCLQRLNGSATPMTQRSIATHATSTRSGHQESSWDQPTPTRHGLGAESTALAVLRDSEETALEAPSMTLNQFVVRTRKASCCGH